MHGFTLDVDRLSGDPERFVFEVDAAWWAARESEGQRERCEVETPFRFELQAVRVGDDIVLEGEFEGRVGLECSRCAKRYSHALRDPLRLALSPVKGRSSSPGTASRAESKAGTGAGTTGAGGMDPEGERALAENGLCLGEDLDAGGYRGPVIRLDDFFGEIIALAMPLQPLCRSECPGICPHCGVDLAETQCDCVDEKIDSPFAVLSKLKGGDD